MSYSDFLRQQAEFCLRLSRSCFDLGTAGQLRNMAAGLTEKASQMAAEQNVAPHMMGSGESREAEMDRK